MSSTANLADVVLLSSKAIQYMRDVRDGGKERSEVQKEVRAICDIFLDLELDLETHDVNDDSTWSKAVRPMFKSDGVVEQLKGVLEELTAKIAPPQHQADSLTKKLKWPFEKNDVQKLLVRLRSCRDTVSIALDRASLALGLDTNADVKKLRHAIETADLDRALQWLSPLDFGQLQKAPQRRPLEGTGNWFLDSPQIRGWCTKRTPALWCHGIPGAGKTILATALMQRLKEEHADGNVAVLIAYCSFDDANTHTSDSLLCSFARQLMEVRGKMSDAVRTLFTEQSKSREKSRPDGKQLTDMLSKELLTFDTTFIIVDGLDEMPSNAEKVKLLQAIESLQPVPQLLVMSRPVPAVAEWFQSAAAGGRYDINAGGDEYEQSLFDCDNCDTGHAWRTYASDDDTYVENDEADNDDDDDETDDDYEVIKLQKDQTKGEEEMKVEEQTTKADWKSAGSYRCENCDRDVCVNCYEKFDVCFGCNREKSTFKWAWPSTLTVTAALEDLRVYILWRIEASSLLRALLDNPLSKSSNLKEQVITRVQAEAHKMFLLAKFHMNVLEEQITPGELRDKLNSLPSNVNDIYNSVFNRIENLRLAPKLERLLIVVATSQRLLTAEALSHALAVSSGDKEVDQWHLPDIPTLAPMCGGLLEMDHLGFVRLAHETIGDYITKAGLQQSKSGHSILAEICLNYLQFSAFESGACAGHERERLIEERRRTYPLLTYAATYWGYHASREHENMPAVLRTDAVKNATLTFLAQRNLVAAAAQFMWIDDLETSSGWDAEEGVDSLHLSAHFGLPDAVSSLLAMGTNVDVLDCLQTTPLMYAAQAGNDDIVMLLLHSGADPSRVCARGRTALHRACHITKDEVLKQLVASPRDIGVNAYDVGMYNLTALMWAVLLESKEKVRLLLTRSDIDLKQTQPDRVGSNVLLMAVSDDLLDITELLLKDGRISVEESTNSDRQTPLCLAASCGYGDMVALLIKHGADMNARDIYDGPPLLRAADYNSLECVRLLIESGADYHFKDFHGRGLLHGAAINAHSSILRYLLGSDLGFDPNIQGDNGETPLHDAVKRHAETVVRVLLDYGARTDIRNAQGKTPLRLARDEDATRLFDLLRNARLKEIAAAEEAASPTTRARMKAEKFAHPSRQDTLAVDYQVPIEVAVRDAKQFKAYLDRVDPAEVDDEIRNAELELLHVATRYGQLDNVRILLDRGADLTYKSEWGFTALHTAMDFDHYEVAEFLLDRGCPIDERDLLNRTALSFAAVEFFRPALAFLLLKRGATFEMERDSLLPILIYAIDCDEFEVVRILVEGGVPFQIKDSRRETPYQRAKKAGHEKIARYLYDQARLKRKGEKTEDAQEEKPETDAGATDEPDTGGEVAIATTLEEPVTNTTEPPEPRAAREPLTAQVHAAAGSSKVTTRELGLIAIIVLLLSLLLYK